MVCDGTMIADPVAVAQCIPMHLICVSALIYIFGWRIMEAEAVCEWSLDGAYGG